MADMQLHRQLPRYDGRVEFVRWAQRFAQRAKFARAPSEASMERDMYGRNALSAPHADGEEDTVMVRTLVLADDVVAAAREAAANTKSSVPALQAELTANDDLPI
jgi:hypothetical protein